MHPLGYMNYLKAGSSNPCDWKRFVSFALPYECVGCGSYASSLHNGSEIFAGH